MWKKIWDTIVDLFTKDPPRQIIEVDLPAEFDKMAEADGRSLNWRTSVVDFLKLLGIDSERENRDELARELGIPNYEGGTAESNEDLRKAVYKKVQENGGNIPASLLD